MRHLRLAFVALILLCLNLNLPSFAQDVSIEIPNTQPRLLSAVIFFRGHVVGRGGFTNGPKISLDKGKTWESMYWPEGKACAVDVSPDGKWVYVAHEIGVMVSRDGGQTWRVGSDRRITEVLDVKVDRHNPRVACAATAYGFIRTTDGGMSWVYPGEQPFGFTSCVCIDRTDSGRIFIGTEEGIYLTIDGGETYRKTGPDSIIRSLWQDLRDPDVIWAGTDGDGLWKTPDGGESWHKINSAGDVVNCIAQHPVYRERIYVGNVWAMRFSFDSGIHWSEGSGQFTPGSSVYAIEFDPDDVSHVWAGCRDGFFESRDAGLTWKLVSEQNGVVNDLLYTDLYVGPPEPLQEGTGRLVINTKPPMGDEYRDTYEPGFDERARIGAQALAGMPQEESVGLMHAVAYIKEGKADDDFYDKVRATLEKPGHSMFWLIEAVGLYLYCKDELPADIAEALEETIIKNPVIRGDTENHWVMYHSGLLLAAQTFPEAGPNEWFNGCTSQEIYDNALAWLTEWARLTSTRGQGEFDSPVYYLTYIMPLQLLYRFAEDPKVVRMAGMVIDLMLADFAADALDGRYCGGHSRIYDTQLRWGDGSRDRHYFYLYFGGIPVPDEFEAWDVPSIYNTYRCPIEIADIAHRREAPFVHTEVKRVRNLMRYADSPESPAHDFGGMMSPPVYRYNYMTPDYCLGSLQGGILQPIQQHTWDVTWKGSAYNSLCFTLHPYWSGYELALFFPEDPHMLTDIVNATKGDYTDPDKWTSSSPYERIYQFGDTLIAAYNVPEGVNTDHADLFMPKCLNHEIRRGWIFGHDGDFYIGIRPLVPGEWIEHEDNWRYRVKAGQAGFIVETGRKADDGGYEEFIDAILQGPMPSLKATENGPEIRCTTRHGWEMAYLWDGDLRLMSEPVVAFPTDKFFAGPLIASDIGSGVIRIFGDVSTRVLDFNDMTVDEFPN